MTTNSSSSSYYRRKHHSQSQLQFQQPASSPVFRNVENMSLSSSSSSLYPSPPRRVVSLDPDLEVLVGGESFYYCSQILCYASQYLSRRIRHRSDGTCQIDLGPDRNANEWRLVYSFLEPRSLSNRTVETHNIAILLPWFYELELQVLLGDCDSLLEHTEFPTLPNSDDIQDVLDLLWIAQLCDLHKTTTRALEVLQVYLRKTKLWTLSDIDYLLELWLASSRNCRYVLWKWIVKYLPKDLDTKKPAELAENPLFSHLIQQGMKLHRTTQTQAEEEEEEDGACQQFDLHSMISSFSGGSSTQTPPRRFAGLRRRLQRTDVQKRKWLASAGGHRTFQC